MHGDRFCQTNDLRNLQIIPCFTKYTWNGTIEKIELKLKNLYVAPLRNGGWE